MVVAYVRLYSSLSSSSSPSPCIYALLLPSADGAAVAELAVRQSPLGGYGAFPVDAANSIKWNNVAATPVLLPYLGVETIVKDACAVDALVHVLKGDFECVTLAELQALLGVGQTHVENGLFAIPRPARSRKEPLPPETPLLQIKTANGVAHYLLADDARTALHLVGERAHLFDLLCAHDTQHEHAAWDFATHVASLERMEMEADTGRVSPHHVLINAHPAFRRLESFTGMVNEPAAREKPTLNMIHAYARLLADDDPLMEQHSLTQPAGAEAAWREHVLQPIGAAAAHKEPWRYSERMVLYKTTCGAYPLEHELTVDYGKRYTRDYASGSHRPTRGTKAKATGTRACAAQRVTDEEEVARPTSSEEPLKKRMKRVCGVSH